MQRTLESAGDTFSRYAHLMQDAGVTRICDVTGLDVVGVPVALGIRPHARSLVVAVGKGLTRDAARVGALMESLECWYAEYVEPELVHVPHSELGEAGVDPARLPLAVDGVADGRPAQMRPTDWVRGYDSLTGEVAWVPFDVVSLDFRTERIGPAWLARNSNGLASGTTVSGAALHGLCEVIERDAEWRWRDSESSHRIDLATIDDDESLSLLESARRAGLTVASWDVTSTIGVPCVGTVVMADPSAGTWGGSGVHDGFACRASRQRAFAAALLEALQKRLTYISGSRDDLTRAEVAHATSPEIADLVWDEIQDETPDTRWSSQSVAAGDTEAEFIQIAQQVVERSGSSPVVVPLSTGEDGPGVAKVVVPGLYGPFGMSLPPQSLAQLDE